VSGARRRITIETRQRSFAGPLREGLVYLTIKNDGGKDTLTGVKVDIPAPRQIFMK
jgi:hypothetical protein